VPARDNPSSILARARRAARRGARVNDPDVNM
jgi:hypothetical protein